MLLPMEAALSNVRRVKILGAGSVGNHLAHAARTLGCDIVVCDIDPSALHRMEHSIYPSRYGGWDSGIRLSTLDDAPLGGFDLICIGTPPEHHIPLALQALEENPRAIQIEKPLCTPALEQAQLLLEKSRNSACRIFVGYDHAVGKAARCVEDLLRAQRIGEVLTIDVEFREHWEGVFRAHPWLDGPADTYLGHWKRGGGASGEHSHAMNLWQHFATLVGAGEVASVTASLRYVENGNAHYDDMCSLQLRTNKGLCGRVVQDVTTRPARKAALLQGTNGSLKWINGHTAESDAVIVSPSDGSEPETYEMAKTRPEDFIEELRHIDDLLNETGRDSPISLERGLDTMLIIAAAHLSEQRGSRVGIDRTVGYTTDALRLQCTP
jgi:predicted dehydrogenase